ncbi:MAG: ABC transporter ATP-binding protein, partial [Pseudomonadota bacterium]
RVAIARALAQEPKVFLLDEPMSALDAKLREDMQVELRLLQQRLGITTIVVTHDQREAMTMADTIVVMSNGRVEQVAPPQEIYHKPANAFVADFIGKANFFDGTYSKGKIEIAGLAFDAPANFGKGSPVRCAIRPENASIVAEPGPNSVTATVSFVRDLGPVKEYHLSSPIGPIIIEYAAGTDAATLSAGDSTFAHLPAEALRVYPRAEKEAA